MANIDYQNGLIIGAACSNFYDSNPLRNQVVFADNSGHTFCKDYNPSKLVTNNPMQPHIPQGFCKFVGYKDSKNNVISFPWTAEGSKSTLTADYLAKRDNILVTTDAEIMRIVTADDSVVTVKKSNSDPAYVVVAYRDDLAEKMFIVLVSETESGCKVDPITQTSYIRQEVEIDTSTSFLGTTYYIYKISVSTSYVFKQAQYLLDNPDGYNTSYNTRWSYYTSPRGVLNYVYNNIDDWLTTY